LDGSQQPITTKNGEIAYGKFPEAPIDALSLAACGVLAIALCGKSWPDWLPPAAAFRQVAVALDADKAGDDTAMALTVQLCSFGASVERWRPSSGKDWNEILMAGPAVLRDALSSALSLPQATAALVQRLRDGQAWLTDQHHLFLADDPCAADGTSFSRALAGWDALEQDLRQKFGFSGCIRGPDQACPGDAPARCSACVVMSGIS